MININKDFLAGTVIGFAAGLTVKKLPGQEQVNLREAAKGTLKWGLSSLETARTQFAQLKETVEDLVAEAKAETRVLGDEPVKAPEEPVVEKPVAKAKGQRHVA